MPITIGSVSFDDIVTNFLANVGKYWGSYGNGQGNFDTVPISAPGVSGTSQVHYGFRTRPVFVNVFYVAASYAACEADYNSDLTIWEDSAVDAFGFTNSYISNAAITFGPNKTGIGTTYYMEATFVFTQRALGS